MPSSISTIAAGDVTTLSGTPTAAQWNANPSLWRSKINEMIAELNKCKYGILDGYAGATTKGLAYYVDGSNLELLSPDLANLNSYIYGIGTGNTGEIQVDGVMEGTSLVPATGIFYLDDDGVLTNTRNKTAGEWVVPLGRGETVNKIHITVNPWAAYQIPSSI